MSSSLLLSSSANGSFLNPDHPTAGVSQDPVSFLKLPCVMGFRQASMKFHLACHYLITLPEHKAFLADDVFLTHPACHVGKGFLQVIGGVCRATRSLS